MFWMLIELSFLDDRDVIEIYWRKPMTTTTTMMATTTETTTVGIVVTVARSRKLRAPYLERLFYVGPTSISPPPTLGLVLPSKHTFLVAFH